MAALFFQSVNLVKKVPCSLNVSGGLKCVFHAPSERMFYNIRRFLQDLCLFYTFFCKLYTFTDVKRSDKIRIGKSNVYFKKKG